jgi:hypothetical protein
MNDRDRALKIRAGRAILFPLSVVNCSDWGKDPKENDAMKHVFVMGGLVLLLAAPLAEAQKGKKAAKPGAVADADMVRSGSFVGRLLEAPGPGGDFNVEIVSQTVVPKQGKAQRGRPAAVNYQTRSTKNTVTFHALPDMKVRLKTPAAAFTEKGDIKKYTPAELSQLKGKDTSLPGYEANLADLHPGQIVRIHQKRAAPAKEGDLTLGTAHRKVVTMIMVLGEGQATQGTPAAKSKKK